MFNKYPYSDLHELNLDWILKKLKELNKNMDDFIGLNSIEYLGSWDIREQYQKWKIVSHDNVGYMSIDLVPAGISIFDTNYWLPIVDYSSMVAGATKRYIFIGDSYNTTDTPSGGYPITPWGPIVAEELGLDNANWYNTGVSGAGFVAGVTFLQQLQALSVSEPETITDIVVCGGVNDQDNLGTLGAAINEFALYCEEHYPNAMITLGMISWGKSAVGRPKYQQVNYYYQTKASLPNVRCIPMAMNFYHNYSLWQTPSQGHPSLAGSRQIACGIANYLKGGECGYTLFSDPIAVVDTTDLPITGGNINLHEEIVRDMATVSILSTINLTLGTSTNIVSGNYYKMYAYAPIYASFNGVVTKAQGFIRSGSTYYPVNFRVKFDDGYISFGILNFDSGGYSNVNSADQIAIYDVIPITKSLFEC